MSLRPLYALCSLVHFSSSPRMPASPLASVSHFQACNARTWSRIELYLLLSWGPNVSLVSPMPSLGLLLSTCLKLSFQQC